MTHHDTFHKKSNHRWSGQVNTIMSSGLWSFCNSYSALLRRGSRAQCYPSTAEGKGDVLDWLRPTEAHARDMGKERAHLLWVYEHLIHEQNRGTLSKVEGRGAIEQAADTYTTVGCFNIWMHGWLKLNKRWPLPKRNVK